MLAQLPDRQPLTWLPKKKMEAMASWSQLVMADHRLTKTELKVAWALTYAFNSEDGRCWETKAVIAKRAGLSESAVKATLTGLDEKGHITRTFEVIRGKKVRVIRPTLSRSFGIPQPRPRRGGVAKGIDPKVVAWERRRTDLQSPQRTDLQSPQGTEGQAPCIQDKSGINPRVSRVRVGTTCPPPPLDDDWEDDTSLMD